MPFTVNKLVSRVIWYGPTQILSAASWKNQVKLIRAVKPDGTGFSSFAPNNTINGLTEVAAGAILEIYALTSAIAPTVPGGFVIETGTAPTAGAAGAIRKVAEFQAGTTAQTATAKCAFLFSDEPGTYDVDPINGPIGVINVSYAVANVQVTLPRQFASGQVIEITATTGAGTGGRVVLIRTGA